MGKIFRGSFGNDFILLYVQGKGYDVIPQNGYISPERRWCVVMIRCLMLVLDFPSELCFLYDPVSMRLYLPSLGANNISLGTL